MSVYPDEEQAGSFALGSSIYGGRPTFALVRDETGNEATITLYELLPTEQADARKRRLERRRRQSSKTHPFHEVIGEDVADTEDWTWDSWVAMKVRQLSGSRLRCLLQLFDEAFRDTDIDPSLITGTGSATVLIPEEPGVRLSLGFIGVKPLQRVDRMRALTRGVARMSLEECYYWHAKCRSPNSPNGAKALRTLLAKHK
ncbi:DUF7680 family protein [Halorussus pelagicus]